MRNPIPAIAIAFVLAAPCTALADDKKTKTFEIHDYGFAVTQPTSAARDPQSGLPTGKRMHKPLTVTKEVNPASPNLTTQNKPINPALQGNVLEKSGAGSPTRPGGYDLKANKGR